MHIFHCFEVYRLALSNLIFIVFPSTLLGVEEGVSQKKQVPNQTLWMKGHGFKFIPQGGGSPWIPLSTPQKPKLSSKKVATQQAIPPTMKGIPFGVALGGIQKK